MSKSRAKMPEYRCKSFENAMKRRIALKKAANKAFAAEKQRREASDAAERR